MPSRHSKNGGDRAYYTHSEKKTAGVAGSSSERIGSESQLPFGHCPLTLNKITEAVVTPSGRIYEREAILEYLLKKTIEIKAMQRDFEAQKEKKFAEAEVHAEQLRQIEIERFSQTQEGLHQIKRILTTEEQGKQQQNNVRKRLIDETSREEKLQELRQVSPWIVQFTPHHDEPKLLKEPPRRPPSPFSGQPLRAKDLVPVNLMPEAPTSDKYICPVSRKTITNQKLVVIKSTGVLMLESIAQELAYPSMTCPITSKRFVRSDVIEIVPAASGFAASGTVEVKKYKPTIN